jgi:hypothetical protein
MVRALTLSIALIIGTPAMAQSAKDSRAARTAFGQRIQQAVAGGSASAAEPETPRVSARLQTRIENRLQTRVERFAPQRADARYAYRSRADDGSRLAPTAKSAVKAPIIVPEPGSDDQ